MSTPNSPPFAELLEWLEGRLPPEQAQAVAARLGQAGEATQADLAWLRAFQQTSQSVKLAAPPPRVRETLRQRFAARTAALPQPPSLFQRWVAALRFDSRLRPATAGLRSATSEGLDRQLMFATDAVEVVLNIQPRRPGRSLAIYGQVFPTGEAQAAPYSVQFLRDGEQAALAATDDLGEFIVEAVAPGTYEVVLSAAEHEVVLNGVAIEA